MSYMIIVLVVLGIPSLVASIFAGGLIAGWRGRSTAEGLLLGLLLGPVGVVAEGLLPAAGGSVAERPDTRHAAVPAGK